MQPAISVTNLSKSYGAAKAVDSLSFSVDKGEFYGFLGPNGAGKTTTIRILTGIISPDEGKALIDGSADRSQYARLLGVMPESKGYYDWMTAKEYLEYFARLYGVENYGKRVEEILELVSLTGRKNSRVGTYSRGMKQRLGLARALIHRPQLLFLDEPTLGLDPQGQKDIHSLLQRLNRQGVTILFSSHLLNEVADLCSKIGIINNGRMVAEGSVAELKVATDLKDSSLTDVFLKLTNV